MTTTDETDPSIDLSIDLAALKRERHVDYDPFAAADLQQNLARLAEFRDMNTMTYSTLGEGFWIATGYDEVVSVLRRNNKGFVSYPNNPLGEPKDGTSAAKKKLIPIDLDGTEHRQYRKLLDPVFSPKNMNALEPQIRKLANDLIDLWIEDGRVDFVEGFAFPFSATTVIVLMGWPLADAHMMNGWVTTLQHGVTNGSQEETIKAQQAAVTECRNYLMTMIEQRRQAPAEDFTTMLMNIEINGRKLDDDELFDTFLLLMLAGLDTVQSVLTQIFAYLGTRPDQWDEIFAEPETLDLAVEEFLRWTAPAPPNRNVVDDYVVVGDVRLPRGERVHCPIGAANRDPKYFPNPDEVDFHRPVKPHLAFGLGPHRCIGIHLARLEIKIAFEELRARMPQFTLDESFQPTGHLGFAWGMENVHLKFPAGKRSGA
ncbi:cytochrome P450 [Jatrophihabitans sp.]|uniref:cytochrome P450 n=1 Tax=Jatrophihabitans sp. TaxID=1932789 RepID=UPI0030C699E0|nr:cypA [Jatrophihabitans sp.]